jgi:hypothetical protein
MKSEKVDHFFVLGNDVTLANGDEFLGLGCAKMVLMNLTERIG